MNFSTLPRTLCRRLTDWRLLFMTALSVVSLHSAPVYAVDGFVGSDQNCATLVGTVPTPKFDKAYFNGVKKIWASADGATGVFFLKSDNGTVVVKFEEGVNVGTVVSRRILKSLNVPSDTLMAEYRDSSDIQKIFSGMMTAANRGDVVDAAKAARFKELTDKLLIKFNGKKNVPKNPPRQVIVTQFLTGFAGSRNLAQAIYYSPAIAKMGAQDKTDANIQFLGAAKALANPHNQSMLGYLYVVDILMGNNDRLLRSWANVGNIFMATGANSEACLVAIDNEAHAPRAAYLAMINYANRVVGGAIATRKDKATNRIMPLKNFNGTYRFQTPADPDGAGTEVALNASALTMKWLLDRIAQKEKAKAKLTNAAELEPALDATVKGEAQTISGKDYLNQLMNHYHDDLGGIFPEFFGPWAAFNGSFYEARPNHPPLDVDGPSADRCQPGWVVKGQGSVKPQAIRHLRTEFSTYISEYLLRMSQAPGEVTAASQFLASDGSSFLPVTFTDNEYVCKTVIDASSIRSAPRTAIESVGLKHIEINWTDFDKNFALGADAAMKDLQDFDGMKPILNAAFATMPNYNTTDVHISGIMARAHFMSLLASLQSNLTMDQIITSILADPDKPDYAQDQSFPATTFTYKKMRNTRVWLPN